MENFSGLKVCKCCNSGYLQKLQAREPADKFNCIHLQVYLRKEPASHKPFFWNNCDKEHKKEKFSSEKSSSLEKEILKNI